MSDLQVLCLDTAINNIETFSQFANVFDLTTTHMSNRYMYNDKVDKVYFFSI